MIYEQFEAQCKFYKQTYLIKLMCYGTEIWIQWKTCLLVFQSNCYILITVPLNWPITALNVSYVVSRMEYQSL